MPWPALILSAQMVVFCAATPATAISADLANKCREMSIKRKSRRPHLASNHTRKPKGTFSASAFQKMVRCRVPTAEGSRKSEIGWPFPQSEIHAPRAADGSRHPHCTLRQPRFVCPNISGAAVAGWEFAEAERDVDRLAFEELNIDAIPFENRALHQPGRALAPTRLA